MEQKYSAFNQLVDNSNTIGVVSHINPDGDNLGSLLAMGKSLELKGKRVIYIKPDLVPPYFEFMPIIEKLERIEENNELGIDLLIVLDCSDEKRLGLNKWLLESIPKIVNIDHHIGNTNFGELNIVDTNSPSTGEICFEIMNALDYPIDSTIAKLIYVSISTDTGRFSYQNVNSRTHEIVAKLYKYDIEASLINEKLYQSRSLVRTKLFIEAISGIRFYRNGLIGVIRVTQNMLEKTGATMEDSEGIVEFLRDTDGVEAACLLKEESINKIKVSLRTKQRVNVNKICSIFGGGGHKRAAGCTLEKNIDEAESILVKEIEKSLNEGD